MTSTHPPDQLSLRHVIALLEVAQSDAYIAELTAEPEESIPSSLALAATSRLLRTVRENDCLPANEVAGLALEEATSLLDVKPIRTTLAGPSLLVLQRVALLVLHNVSHTHTTKEEPF